MFISLQIILYNGLESALTLTPVPTSRSTYMHPTTRISCEKQPHSISCNVVFSPAKPWVIAWVSHDCLVAVTHLHTFLAGNSEGFVYGDYTTYYAKVGLGASRMPFVMVVFGGAMIPCDLCYTMCSEVQ